MHFGYTSFVINPLIDNFKIILAWDNSSQKLNVSLLSVINPIGALLGCILAKYIIAYGRLRAIYISNVLIVLGGSLTLVRNIPAILVGRFILGFSGCGMATVIVPKFIYETAPIQLRGKLGALSQFMTFNGCLIAFTVAFGTPESTEDT